MYHSLQFKPYLWNCIELVTEATNLGYSQRQIGYKVQIMRVRREDLEPAMGLGIL